MTRVFVAPSACLTHVCSALRGVDVGAPSVPHTLPSSRFDEDECVDYTCPSPSRRAGTELRCVVDACVKACSVAGDARFAWAVYASEESCVPWYDWPH